MGKALDDLLQEYNNAPAPTPTPEATPAPTPEQNGPVYTIQGTPTPAPTPQPTPEATPNVFDQALAKYPKLKDANPVGLMSTNAQDLSLIHI